MSFYRTKTLVVIAKTSWIITFRRRMETVCCNPSFLVLPCHFFSKGSSLFLKSDWPKFPRNVSAMQDDRTIGFHFNCCCQLCWFERLPKPDSTKNVIVAEDIGIAFCTAFHIWFGSLALVTKRKFWKHTKCPKEKLCSDRGPTTIV